VDSLIGDIHTLQTVNGEQNVGDSIYVGDMNTLSFMAGMDPAAYPDLVMPITMMQLQQASSVFDTTPPTVTPQPQQQPQQEQKQ
jgi:hypothetical protein